MIQTKTVNVSASFDSGTFMCFSVSNAKAKGYSSHETNIQSAYNLTDKDFVALEILIASSINNYIKGK